MTVKYGEREKMTVSIEEVAAAIAMIIVVWGYGKMLWKLAESTGFYEAIDVCNELKRLHAQQKK